MSDQNIGEIALRVDSLEERVEDYHARLGPLEAHRVKMETELHRLSSAEGRIDRMDERWQTLDRSLVELKTRVTTVGALAMVLLPIVTGTVTALIVRYLGR